MKQNTYQSFLNIFLDKILQNLYTGTVLLNFNASIEAGWNANDFFSWSKSNSVNKSM